MKTWREQHQSLYESAPRAIRHEEAALRREIEALCRRSVAYKRVSQWYHYESAAHRESYDNETYDQSLVAQVLDRDTLSKQDYVRETVHAIVISSIYDEDESIVDGYECGEEVDVFSVDPVIGSL